MRRAFFALPVQSHEHVLNSELPSPSSACLRSCANPSSTHSNSAFQGEILSLSLSPCSGHLTPSAAPVLEHPVPAS